MPYKDPKKQAQYKHDWYLRHREQKRAYDRVYRAQNREQRKAYAKMYHQKYVKEMSVDGD